MVSQFPFADIITVLLLALVAVQVGGNRLVSVNLLGQKPVKIAFINIFWWIKQAPI